MEKLITVFTPTYNRDKVLHRCYECLKKQTSNNFKWLIIDDGSKDSTKTLVQNWIQESKSFEIEYHYKENGGLHTAYNLALEYVNTLVFVCLESDDIFTEDAIRVIENLWDTISSPRYVGAITLCKDPNGNMIGSRYPELVHSVFFRDHKLIAKGDKQYVFKTEALKKIFPMKVFEGEKYFDPNYQFYQLDTLGKLYVKNIAFDIVDYQAGGLTDTVIKQYYNSPNSFAEFRKLHLQLPNKSWKYLYKESIHYVSSCFLAGKWKSCIIDAPRKIYVLLAFIPGLLFSRYIIYMNSK